MDKSDSAFCILTYDDYLPIMQMHDGADALSSGQFDYQVYAPANTGN